ncbi:MAG: hypothetical protein NTU95_05120 [Methanothrix sp.]|nr:hypothetical protein [Methanothrix sp.]
MPTRLEEVENAMEVVQMELGEPDASGRRSPRMKKGLEHIVDVDTVVISMGTVPKSPHRLQHAPA